MEPPGSAWKDPSSPDHKLHMGRRPVPQSPTCTWVLLGPKASGIWYSTCGQPATLSTIMSSGTMCSSAWMLRKVRLYCRWYPRGGLCASVEGQLRQHRKVPQRLAGTLVPVRTQALCACQNRKNEKIVGTIWGGAGLAVTCIVHHSGSSAGSPSILMCLSEHPSGSQYQ